MGKSHLRLAVPVLLAVLFLIIISSFALAVTFYPVYNSAIVSPSLSATFDTTMNLSIVASYGGTPLSSGDRVCLGQVDISAPLVSSYATDASRINVKVPCARYYANGTCRGYDTATPSPPSQSISWVTEATYNSVLAEFAPYPSSKCYPSQILTFPIAINSDVTAAYYNDASGWSGDRMLGNGRASIVQFCWGTKTMEYILNGTQTQLSQMPIESAGIISFDPNFTTGVYTFTATGIVKDCSVVTRSWEVYNSIPVRNCLYQDPSNTFRNYILSSDNTMTLSFFVGPIMNVTSYSIDSRVEEGGTGSFSLTVKNDGDINMTVDPAAITFTGGFTFVSSTPSSSFMVAPGETHIITGVFRAPYPFETPRNVTITIPFAGSEALVGTCDDATSVSFMIGQVAPMPPNELTLRLNVNPSGIPRGLWHNITITVEATRGGQRVPPVSSTYYRIDRWDNDSQSWLRAPTWSADKYFTFTYTPSDTETRGDVTIREPVHYLGTGEDWQTGIYKVTAFIYDNRRSEQRSVSNYFVIYYQDCYDR
ncbi:MAG: hypothetical protein QW112_01060 [Candidatus Micrarchaeia archaeon]